MSGAPSSDGFYFLSGRGLLGGDRYSRKGHFARTYSNRRNGRQVGRLTSPVQVWVWAALLPLGGVNGGGGEASGSAM